MKGRILTTILILICPLFAAAGNRVNIRFEGEALAVKDREKVEKVLEYMSDFYYGLDMQDTLDIKILIFKTRKEGYAYMREIRPDDPNFIIMPSDSYFSTGTAGVYLEDSNTAVILGMEKGVDIGMKIIFHEMSHHFTDLVFGYRTAPIWLNEGLAEHFEYISYNKRKGWHSEFPEYAKGQLKSMILLGELDLMGLIDMSSKDFMDKHRYEGQTYYSFAHSVIAVLLSDLPDEMFRKLVSGLVTRPTDREMSDVIGSVYPGGFAAFETRLRDFIMN